MSGSYTFSESQTFTITHARQLASKVATDLKRIQRFYGSPGDDEIDAYENELIPMLKNGYLKDVTYGYRRNGTFIEPSLKYTAKELMGMEADDDDPGRVLPGANIKGAYFGSYMNYTSKWFALSEKERKEFEEQLPFGRVTAAQPKAEGNYIEDKTYSSGGQSLNRSSLKK